jgi:hypothetical protein
MKHDAHVIVWQDWWMCSYRTLPYHKQACYVCEYFVRCNTK